MLKTPSIIYGTAWKEDRTQELTKLALQEGFTAIDTANQRKHYFEEAVGEGFLDFLKSSQRSRADFFIQTKYTYKEFQDDRLPYNPEDPIAKQVEDSVQSSLQHFKTEYLDSLILHGPLGQNLLNTKDFESWTKMEELLEQKVVRAIGVSNFSLSQLQELSRKAKSPISFVQNRCYAAKEWDRDIRKFCRENKMIYQGFSLLTANVLHLSKRRVQDICDFRKATLPQVLFQFCKQVGILPLTGTTRAQHMKEDLQVLDFELFSNEIETIEFIAKQ